MQDAQASRWLGAGDGRYKRYNTDVYAGGWGAEMVSQDARWASNGQASATDSHPTPFRPANLGRQLDAISAMQQQRPCSPQTAPTAYSQLAQLPLTWTGRPAQRGPRDAEAARAPGAAGG